jgi:hypothetical protein
MKLEAESFVFDVDMNMLVQGRGVLAGIKDVIAIAVGFKDVWVLLCNE